MGNDFVLISVLQMEFRFFFALPKFEVSILRIVKLKEKEKKSPLKRVSHAVFLNSCDAVYWVLTVWSSCYGLEIELFSGCYDYLIKQYIMCDSYFPIAAFSVIFSVWKAVLTIDEPSLRCQKLLFINPKKDFPVRHCKLLYCIYKVWILVVVHQCTVLLFLRSQTTLSFWTSWIVC